jgi:SAM-dependent methyltransferase
MTGEAGLPRSRDGNPRVRADWLDCFSEPILREASMFLGERASTPFLDLGCSGGNRSEGIGAPSPRVGLDIDPGALRVAGSEHPSDFFVCGDMTRLPFRSGAIGSVFCFSAMQYTDRRSVLGEVSRVLREGGRCAFVENSAVYGPTAVLDLLRRLPGRRPLRHLGRSEERLYSEFFRVEGRSGHHLLATLSAVPGVLLFAIFGKEIPARPGPAFGLLRSIDRFLLKRLPGLERSSWMQLLLLSKKGDRGDC